VNERANEKDEENWIPARMFVRKKMLPLSLSLSLSPWLFLFAKE